LIYKWKLEARNWKFRNIINPHPSLSLSERERAIIG
jgi:hypothetical protein